MVARYVAQKHLLALCFMLSLAPCLILAFSQPLLSRLDEPAHIDVISQYASGKWPSSTSTVTGETLNLMRHTQTFGWNSAIPNPRPPNDKPVPMPANMTTAARQLWITRHLWQYSYESGQPPLYYALMTPVWLAGRSLFGIIGAVYALRAINALFAALLAPATFLLAIEIWPRRPLLAFASAALVGILPGIVINMTHVTNDTLAALLGTCALLASARMLVRGGGLVATFPVAILLGLGIATRLTVAGLLPAVAFAVVAARPRSRALSRLSVFLTGLALCLGPWLALNLLHFGAPAQRAAAVALNTIPGYQPSIGAIVVEVLYVFVTLTAGEPVGVTVRPALPLLSLGLLLLGLAVAGWLRGLRWPSASWQPMVMLAAAATAELALACVVPGLLGSGFNSPGRYAASAAGAMVILIALGVARELRTLPKQAIAAVAIAASIVAALAADLAGGLHFYAAPLAAPPSTVALRNVRQSTVVDALAVSLDSVGFDRSTNTLWVHVNATNIGTTYAEWDPLATALIRGQDIGVADGRQVNQFAYRVDPGDSSAGWLVIGMSSAQARTPNLQLVFKDIATNDYSHIAKVHLSVNAPG